MFQTENDRRSRHIIEQNISQAVNLGVMIGQTTRLNLARFLTFICNPFYHFKII